MVWDGMMVKELRLRLGWCTANLARRLSCSPQEVLRWEMGDCLPDSHYCTQLNSLLKFADSNADWIQQRTLGETLLKENRLEQISQDEIYRLMDKS